MGNGERGEGRVEGKGEEVGRVEVSGKGRFVEGRGGDACADTYL